MIYVGIDDTDSLDSPGTNQLARRLIREVSGDFHCELIVRHQLLFDERVPYTSKNSSAALLFTGPGSASDEAELTSRLKSLLAAWSAAGSDPGLCVTQTVPPAVSDFGRRCQEQVVTQAEAKRLADEHGLYLEGLGGTRDGLIGALAAVGLAATGNDGRVVQVASHPDTLSGWCPADVVFAHGVEEIRSVGSRERVHDGMIDIGKHLRPNLRQGRVVLYVSPAQTAGRWEAQRFT